MNEDWWSDYYDTPSKGLAKGEISVVVAEITVNTRGYFESCVGHAYIGNPKMGPYVCSRLQMRAGFEPARGPDGRKVVGIYRKLIMVANVNAETSFRVPTFGIHIRGTTPTGNTNPFEIQFFLDTNGQVSDCSLIQFVGIHLEKHRQVVDPETVQHACGQVAIQLKPQPPRDKRGNPIPTTQNALVITDGPLETQNQ